MRLRRQTAHTAHRLAEVGSATLGWAPLDTRWLLPEARSARRLVEEVGWVARLVHVWQARPGVMRPPRLRAALLLLRPPRRLHASRRAQNLLGKPGSIANRTMTHLCHLLHMHIHMHKTTCTCDIA